MARGKSWSPQERQYAAKAYIVATTNSVAGCDQTSENFAKSLHYQGVSVKDVHCMAIAIHLNFAKKWIMICAWTNLGLLILLNVGQIIWHF